MITVTAIVVAYGSEPWLEQVVEAVLGSTGVDVEIVLVDNGDTSGAVDRLTGRSGIRVLRPGANTGFAEGCNVGARASNAEVLVLVNPDAVVEPTALARLAAVAMEPGVGVATGSIRLGNEPDLMNSAGNPVHYLGLAWAGAHGEPVAAHATRQFVASASGACCAIRRTLWADLDGFDPAYFAYHEDVELSLRCWQRGLSVVYVPDAVVRHFYEFSRNDLKSYLLERNRWLTLLTLYSGRTLLLLAPPLAGLEMMVLLTSAVQGWLPAKVRGYRWLLGHVGVIRRRRGQLQLERQRTDRQLAPLLAARFEPTNLPSMPGLPVLNSMLATYWAIVRRFL